MIHFQRVRIGGIAATPGARLRAALFGVVLAVFAAMLLALTIAAGALALLVRAVLSLPSAFARKPRGGPARRAEADNPINSAVGAPPSAPGKTMDLHRNEAGRWD